MIAEKIVPGSIQELEDASGEKITDLHKPQIDEVFVDCKNAAKRLKEFKSSDSWIKQDRRLLPRHFLFDPSTHSVNSGQAIRTSRKLDDFYPPDFIAEYTGQIRAWFYVLLCYRRSFV